MAAVTSDRDASRSKTPSPTTTKKAFIDINERPVDDISLEIFYKPHTISLLLFCIVGLFTMAFSRDSTDFRSNVVAGSAGVIFFFMVVSILVFPNGPFIRPHPIVWRAVFGCSVLWLLLIQFLIHQDYKTVRSLMVWMDKDLANYTIDMDKEYGVNCWDITWEKIYSHFDWFAFAHFWGWVMMTLLIRHYGICWSVSIMWELTEIAFGHLLPNFWECWWDNIVLDILICNNAGIFVGMQVVRFLEMREHHWESISVINSRTGKLKRALLQFTPETFHSTRWLDPGCSWMRFLAIFQLIFVFQVVLLNTFFVKHIFPMPTPHPFNFFRIVLNGLMGAPSIRQYYYYVTNRSCKRLGSQAWVFICITISELILCIKFGLDLFSNTQISAMVAWLVLNLVIACLGLVISMKIYQWKNSPVIGAESVSAAAASGGGILDSPRKVPGVQSESGDSVRRRKYY